MNSSTSVHATHGTVAWQVRTLSDSVVVEASSTDERGGCHEVWIFGTWDQLAELYETLDANPALRNLVRVRQMQRDAEANAEGSGGGADGADVHPFASAHDRAITRQAAQDLRGDNA